MECKFICHIVVESQPQISQKYKNSEKILWEITSYTEFIRVFYILLFVIYVLHIFSISTIYNNFECIWHIPSLSYILSTQHRAWHTIGHSNIFLNEYDVGPVSPTTQQGWKNGNGLPRWAVLVPDAPTVCKTGLGAEIDGGQHLAKTAGAPDGWEQSDSGSHQVRGPPLPFPEGL